MARAHRRLRGRAVRSRACHRRAPGGRRDPRLHLGRALGAGQGLRQGAGRFRLAARRRQALPADGLQRGRADRLARLRRAAGRALAGAPEPRRLLQGDRRRGHQPGDRPRARDRALLDPGRVRAPPLGPRPGHRHADDRDLLRGDPRRPPRPGAPLRLDLPQDRPRAQDLPARGPVGGVPRPRGGDRHRPAGVGDHPRRDRAHQAGGREAGSPRRRAPRAHRPHRVRRRAPLPRPSPGDLRGRPGPEAAQGGRDRRGEPQAPLLDRAALGGDPQRPRRRHGARAGRQRRLPLRDGRGDLRRGLRRRRLQPLLGAAQGDREGDLDDRHPRGARLRAPVLLDRREAGAGRDPPVRDLLRLGRGPGSGSQTSTATPTSASRSSAATRRRSRRRRSASTRRSTRRPSRPPTAPPPTRSTPRRSATWSARARSRCATSSSSGPIAPPSHRKPWMPRSATTTTRS